MTVHQYLLKKLSSTYLRVRVLFNFRGYIEDIRLSWRNNLSLQELLLQDIPVANSLTIISQACGATDLSATYLFFQTILGHGKFNQLGGVFVNGKPLPNSVRQRIIEMAELGIRPCDISRQLKVSHGCISKLLSKYNDTGSFEPGRAQRKTSRDVSSEVKNKIEEYRRAAPGIFSWEVKEKLVADGYCTKESLPPLTVISRMLRRVKSTGSDYMDKTEAENSDAESEGDTSSTNSGDTGTPKPRPKRRSFSIANILSINEETRTVSLNPSTSSSSREEPGKT